MGPKEPIHLDGGSHQDEGNEQPKTKDAMTKNMDHDGKQNVTKHIRIKISELKLLLLYLTI